MRAGRGPASSPIRFRPVGVDEAREILRERFAAEEKRTFEYVDDVREAPGGGEQREDVRTVRGRSRVDDRVWGLSEAIERIVFGARLPEFVTGEIERPLEERAVAGVDVVAVSTSPAERDRLGDFEG